MKKYDEMARDVLDRIGEYEAERKLKRIRTAKIAAAVTPVCTAAVVGGGIWLSGAFMHADKPAPADSLTSLTVIVKSLGQPSFVGSSDREYCVFATHTGILSKPMASISFIAFSAAVV